MNIEDFTILRNLPERDIQALKVNTRKIEFLPNDSIVSKGSQIEFVYFILSGRVKEVTYTRSGKEIVFNMLSNGDYFGLVPTLSVEKSRSDFIATNITHVSVIRVKDFLHLIRTRPSISQSVLAEFARANLTFLDKLYEIRAMDVSGRTQAELLRHLPNESDTSDSTYVEFTNLPTHEEIANTIFTHREAVTKEISKLKKSGVIIGMSRNRLAANSVLLHKMVAEFS